MNTILSIGVLLLGALVAERLVARIKVPGVTAYILLGVLLGPSLFNMLGSELIDVSDVLSNIVLGFIAFHIGGNFSGENFRKIGSSVLVLSLIETSITFLLVMGAIFLVTAEPLYMAAVYGAIAAATAPTATMMIVMQYNARGAFTDLLLGIVSMDDAWGVIIFSFALFFAVGADAGTGGNGFFTLLSHVGLELLTALLIGTLAAFIVRFFGKYVQRRGDALTFILGTLLFCTGTALYFDVSALMANIVFGAVIINLEPSSFRFFDHLKKIDWPLYIMFYVLVGANLKLELLSSLGLVAIVYVLFRIAGKVLGAYVGARACAADRSVRQYMGLALMPQAGVALGLALLAKSRFPEMGEMLFVTITATTILYEMVGPFATRYALVKSGDIEAQR
ncbi:MAG: cation:proton antiporter [Proteobacteria bacterium]|nr:cation:proton antiporter [Pseudomonadota bacterium]